MQVIIFVMIYVVNIIIIIMIQFVKFIEIYLNVNKNNKNYIDNY